MFEDQLQSSRDFWTSERYKDMKTKSKEEIIEQYFTRENVFDGYTTLIRKCDGFRLPMQVLGIYSNDKAEEIGQGSFTPQLLVD
jgi:hypothetical protein